MQVRLNLKVLELRKVHFFLKVKLMKKIERIYICLEDFRNFVQFNSIKRNFDSSWRCSSSVSFVGISFLLHLSFPETESLTRISLMTIFPPIERWRIIFCYWSLWNRDPQQQSGTGREPLGSSTIVRRPPETILDKLTVSWPQRGPLPFVASS